VPQVLRVGTGPGFGYKPRHHAGKAMTYGSEAAGVGPRSNSCNLAVSPMRQVMTPVWETAWLTWEQP
jgi:hypothetical protein